MYAKYAYQLQDKSTIKTHSDKIS